jgi:hypothetical protein
MIPTREQILNEPAGRQMDAWVAEFVMGWPQWDFKNDWEGSFPMWRDDEGVLLYTTYDDPHYWSPSKDIAAAWQVVEKLHGPYTLNVFTSDFDRSVGFCCHIRRVGTFPSSFAYEYGDTAPLAVCRAALLAVLEVA